MAVELTDEMIEKMAWYFTGRYDEDKSLFIPSNIQEYIRGFIENIEAQKERGEA